MNRVRRLLEDGWTVRRDEHGRWLLCCGEDESVVRVHPRTLAALADVLEVDDYASWDD